MKVTDAPRKLLACNVLGTGVESFFSGLWVKTHPLVLPSIPSFISSHLYWSDGILLSIVLHVKYTGTTSRTSAPLFLVPIFCLLFTRVSQSRPDKFSPSKHKVILAIRHSWCVLLDDKHTLGSFSVENISRIAFYAFFISSGFICNRFFYLLCRIIRRGLGLNRSKPVLLLTSGLFDRPRTRHFLLNWNAPIQKHLTPPEQNVDWRIQL